jgi:hypothetical protein
MDALQQRWNYGNPPTVVDWFLGMDLGQVNDPSAIAAVERTSSADSPARYAVRHLERFPLGTPYPSIVTAVSRLVQTPIAGKYPLSSCPLIIDGTGVGRAVCDMFMVSNLADRIVRVTITAGMDANFDGSAGCWHVPKLQLVSVLQSCLQGERLKAAPGLPEAQTLARELRTFRVKITSAGNETFEAWRERDHDDLVLALAIALWYADRHPPEAGVMPEVLIPGSRLLSDLYGTGNRPRW